MFVVRGLVSQRKWQRWSNHWYVLVGSKSSSGGRGLLWYPKHVVSAADTSQPSVQNIVFFVKISLFSIYSQDLRNHSGRFSEPLGVQIKISWGHMSKFESSRQNRLRTRLWKCFCYGELDYDIPEGSKAAFFSQTLESELGVKFVASGCLVKNSEVCHLLGISPPRFWASVGA